MCGESEKRALAYFGIVGFMAATLSTDTVKCEHCNLTLKKKNLKEHTKAVHGSETRPAFTSTVSSDIRGLFSGPPSKISKTSLSQEKVSQQQGSSDGSEDAESSAILSELRSLQSKVDQLDRQKRQPIVLNTADLSAVLNIENSLEIVASCRSVEIILSLFRVSPSTTIRMKMVCIARYVRLL